MKKQYFFARLFVRTAKGLALLVILFGIGFCVLRCYQASSAADAVAYQPSPHLQQALDGLKDTFLSTEQIVDSFNAGNQSTTPGVQGPRFPIVIDSNDDLDRIATELSRVDQERQKLKESIVARLRASRRSFTVTRQSCSRRRRQRLQPGKISSPQLNQRRRRSPRKNLCFHRSSMLPELTTGTQI